MSSTTTSSIIPRCVECTKICDIPQEALHRQLHLLTVLRLYRRRRGNDPAPRSVSAVSPPLLAPRQLASCRWNCPSCVNLSLRLTTVAKTPGHFEGDGLLKGWVATAPFLGYALERHNHQSCCCGNVRGSCESCQESVPVLLALPGDFQPEPEPVTEQTSLRVGPT